MLEARGQKIAIEFDAPKGGGIRLQPILQRWIFALPVIISINEVGSCQGYDSSIGVKSLRLEVSQT